MEDGAQVALRSGLLCIVSQIIGAFLVFAFGSLVGRQLPTTGSHATALGFGMIDTVLLVFVVTRVVLLNVSPEADALALSWPWQSASPSLGPTAEPGYRPGADAGQAHLRLAADRLCYVRKEITGRPRNETAA